MTAKAAICKSLLFGEVISIKTGFTDFGVTNIPREIPRAIERPFDVKVSRTRMTGKSRWSVPVSWTNYRLNMTEYNFAGVKKMVEYVLKQEGTPKTERQARDQDKLKQLLKL